jgi:hypothetical protein
MRDFIERVTGNAPPEAIVLGVAVIGSALMLLLPR